MRILLTGANGFIGSHLTGALLADGHEVVAAVRDPAAMRRRFPRAEAVHADLNHAVNPSDWAPRLKGVDAVINCAGVLQQGPGQSIEAIHHQAPAALFDACAAAGVRRVIQISAISADPAAGTAYAASKKRADDHLARLDLDWVILRPSLVYAQGSYGGTSLMRALAAFPFAIPLVGDGGQAFRPIHIDDLTATVLRLLDEPSIRRQVIEPVGPETLTLRDILAKLRGWLGFAPAPMLSVPLPLVRLACRLGDLFNAGPIRTTALKQMTYGNVAPVDSFIAATGIVPRSMDAALARHPAQTQDRWHARLYLLRPLLRLSLALFWIATGLIMLLPDARDESAHLLLSVGVPQSLNAPAFWTGCLLDLLLGGLLLTGWRTRMVCGAMLAVTFIYLVALTIGLPALWAAPLGPLTKAVVVMVATLVLMAIAEER